MKVNIENLMKETAVKLTMKQMKEMNMKKKWKK